uniref:Uncharacterized protein n=1 Tax=Aegilops tauschii TaxID=37682 RepID=M8BJ60_AEGTA
MSTYHRRLLSNEWMTSIPTLDPISTWYKYIALLPRPPIHTFRVHTFPSVMASNSPWSAMKAGVEVEDQEPVITGFNNNDRSYNGVNHDKNKKPDSLELRLWWPCETMQQEDIRVMQKGKKVTLPVGNKVKVPENGMSIHQSVIVPSARKYWTDDEHK